MSKSRSPLIAAFIFELTQDSEFIHCSLKFSVEQAWAGRETTSRNQPDCIVNDVTFRDYTDYWLGIGVCTAGTFWITNYHVLKFEGVFSMFHINENFDLSGSFGVADGIRPLEDAVTSVLLENPGHPKTR